MTKIEFTKEWLHANAVAIECDNEKEAKRICEIFGSEFYSYDNTDRMYVPYCISFKYSLSVDSFANISWTGLENIKQTLKASEVIAQYEASNPKIIGYRCPFDMYQQENDFLVNKGDLYVIAHEGSNCYTPKKWIECDLPKDIQTLYIPFEIVEQLFEPVYEEKPKYLIGSFPELINMFNDSDYIVLKKGEPISVTNSVSEHIIKREYYFHLNKMNDYGFTPEFEQKLKEMGINI